LISVLCRQSAEKYLFGQ